MFKNIKALSKRLNYKIILILASLVVLAVGATLVAVTLISKSKANGDFSQSIKQDIPPELGTKDINAIKDIGDTVTADKIILSNSTKVTNGDKVVVWIYPTPQFLGYFNVKSDGGLKYIDGLSQVLKKLNINNGDYNILLLSSTNGVIGRIAIRIDATGSMSSITQDSSSANSSAVKEITVQESIPFATTTTQSVNMPRGITKLQTAGVNGIRNVIYKVIYDSAGKEVNRMKVKEYSVKQSTTQVTVIGIGDYNLNNNLIAMESTVAYCPKSISSIIYHILSGVAAVVYSKIAATIDNCSDGSSSIKKNFYVIGVSIQNAQDLLDIQASQYASSSGLDLLGGGTGPSGTHQDGVVDSAWCLAHGFNCGSW